MIWTSNVSRILGLFKVYKLQYIGAALEFYQPVSKLPT